MTVFLISLELTHKIVLTIVLPVSKHFRLCQASNKIILGPAYNAQKMLKELVVVSGCNFSNQVHFIEIKRNVRSDNYTIFVIGTNS